MIHSSLVYADTKSAQNPLVPRNSYKLLRQSEMMIAGLKPLEQNSFIL